MNNTTRFLLRNWITPLLVLTNVLVYILSWQVNRQHPDDPFVITLFKLGADFTPLVQKGEYYRLFCAAFMHLNIMHLVNNCISLLAIGLWVENITTKWEYTTIYLLSIFGSSLASCLYSEFSVSVGASGAIYGLFGYLLIVNFTNFIYNFSEYYSQFLLYVFLVLSNLFSGMKYAEIDSAAHVGGFFTGILICFIFYFLEANEVNKFKKITYTTIAISIMCWGVFQMIPNYYTWYYDSLKVFLKNEKEAIKLWDMTNISEEKANANYAKAAKLWLTNQNGLEHKEKNFPQKLREDIGMLSFYAKMKKKASYLYLNEKINDTLLLDSTRYFADRLRMFKMNYPALPYIIGYDSLPHSKDTMVVAYFDANWKELTDKKKALYYRRGHKDYLGRWNGLVNDFYTSGKLQMRGYYKNGKQNGECFYYFTNGKIQSKGVCYNDFHSGYWDYYFASGKLKEQVLFERSYYLMNKWDSTGTQIIRNGEGTYVSMYGNGKLKETGLISHRMKNGIWTTYYENGKAHYVESFQYNHFLGGVIYDSTGKGTKYNVDYQLAEPKEGNDKFEIQVKASLKYPRRAIVNQIYGVVWVEAKVDSVGNVSNIRVPIKMGYGCDEEAIRLVKQYANFKPTIERGIAITSVTELPVVFSLP